MRRGKFKPDAVPDADFHYAVERLEQATDRATMVVALDAIYAWTHARYRTEEGPGGLLSDLLLVAPQEARAVARLRSQHAEIDALIVQLRDALRIEVDGVPGDHGQAISALCQLIRRREADEANVIAKLSYWEEGEGDG